MNKQVRLVNRPNHPMHPTPYQKRYMYGLRSLRNQRHKPAFLLNLVYMLLYSSMYPKQTMNSTRYQHRYMYGCVFHFLNQLDKPASLYRSHPRYMLAMDRPYIHNDNFHMCRLCRCLQSYTILLNLNNARPPMNNYHPLYKT